MIMRILSIFRFELAKVMRWRFIYVAIVLALIGCGLASLVPEYLHTEQHAELNGYILFGVISHYGVFPVGATLVLVFAALLVGQEYAHKTLPVFASQPVRRYEIVVAKILSALAFNFVLVALIFTVSFVVSLSMIGFEPIQFDADTILTLGTLWPHLVYAALFTMLPLLAVSCTVMALTFITENAGFSIGIALGTALIAMLLRFVKSAIKEWSIVEYIGNPTSSLVDIGEQMHVDWAHDAGQLVLVSAVYIVVSVVVMVVVFGRKDVV